MIQSFPAADGFCKILLILPINYDVTRAGRGGFPQDFKFVYLDTLLIFGEVRLINSFIYCSKGLINVIDHIKPVEQLQVTIQSHYSTDIITAVAHFNFNYFQICEKLPKTPSSGF